MKRKFFILLSFIFFIYANNIDKNTDIAPGNNLKHFILSEFTLAKVAFYFIKSNPIASWLFAISAAVGFFTVFLLIISSNENIEFNFLNNHINESNKNIDDD